MQRSNHPTAATGDTPTDAGTPASRSEQFLSGAEHALRSQLTLVTGYAQMVGRQLRHDAIDRTRARAYDVLLDHEIHQFQGQIELYLTATRLHSGDWTPPQQTVELVGLTHRALARSPSSSLQ